MSSLLERTKAAIGAVAFPDAPVSAGTDLFCGHCGERLPRFGARLGYCAPCAQSFRTLVNQQRPRRVAPPPPPVAVAVHRRDPLLASLLSGILPGGGQVYNGHFVKAGLVFVTAPLVLPWIIGVVDAFFSARKINERAGES